MPINQRFIDHFAAEWLKRRPFLDPIFFHILVATIVFSVFVVEAFKWFSSLILFDDFGCWKHTCTKNHRNLEGQMLAACENQGPSQASSCWTFCSDSASCAVLSSRHGCLIGTIEGGKRQFHWHCGWKGWFRVAKKSVASSSSRWCQVISLFCYGFTSEFSPKEYVCASTQSVRDDLIKLF